MNRRQIVAANWKMNGSTAANDAWLRAVCGRASGLACDTVVFPPFPYLAQVLAAAKGSGLETGAQSVSERTAGAWTGETSAEMLLDLGATWAIIGHSERRAHFGETDAIVAAKVARSIAAGIRPVLCIGETLAEREAGRTLDVVTAQLEAVLKLSTGADLATGAIAYEPVWAIGTGRTASPEQAQEVHAAIRRRLLQADAQAGSATRILYGGSVKPGNAGELFSQPDIDGGLIGGASLIAEDFLGICASARS